MSFQWFLQLPPFPTSQENGAWLKEGIYLTDDMSKFNKAKWEVKLTLFVSAHEGGFTGRQGKNSLDFSMVPASSWAVLSYLSVLIFMPWHIAPLAAAQGLAFLRRAQGRYTIWRKTKSFEECVAHFCFALLQPCISEATCFLQSYSGIQKGRGKLMARPQQGFW